MACDLKSFRIDKCDKHLVNHSHCVSKRTFCRRSIFKIISILENDQFVVVQSFIGSKVSVYVTILGCGM